MSLPKSPSVVITGASSGLGKAFCEVLSKEKPRLVIGDVDVDGAERTAEEVRSAGGEAVVMSCDVRDPLQVEALINECESRFGGIDLLINNAGVAVGGAIGDVPLEDWKWVVEVNLWGMIYGCHYAVPRMKARGSGHVLNVASAAGLISVPNGGPYNVTKSAVVSLSETLCGEVSSLGLGVTVLCPTFFPTEIVNSGKFSNDGLQKTAAKIMRGADISAQYVARDALRAVNNRELYAVPMRDGRYLWRAKRANPSRFYKTLTWLTPWVEKLAGKR